MTTQNTHDDMQARLAFAARSAKFRTVLGPLTHMVMLSFFMQNGEV